MRRRLTLAAYPILERYASFMLVQSAYSLRAFTQFLTRFPAVSRRTAARLLRHGTVVCSPILLALILAANGSLTAKPVGAAPEPDVFVAVDATSSSCVYTRTAGNHTRSAGGLMVQAPISATRMPCPAGTIMELKSIPLSQAAAKHEEYVLPLSRQASMAQQKQWEDQIQHLLQVKRRLLQASQAISPSTTCGYTVTIYSGYHVIFNDDIQGRITYYLSSSCSQVYLDTVYTDVGYVPYNNIVWWLEFDYAAYHDTCDRNGAFHELFPNTTYSFHPNQWHTAGYYGLYTFQWAGTPGCFYGGGGPDQTLAVGPLN